MLLSRLLSFGRFLSVMLPHTGGVVEGCMLACGVLRLVVELSGRSVDVDVPLGSAVLVALNCAVFSFSAEVLGIFRV